jgi:hypothetical protein
MNGALQTLSTFQNGSERGGLARLHLKRGLTAFAALRLLSVMIMRRSLQCADQRLAYFHRVP